MDAFQILVIILGATLAIFLILGIVVLAYLIKVLQHVKRITQKAESVASYAESAGRTMFATATPMVVAKALVKIIKKSVRK